MAIPPWLKTMRDITGTKEVAGGADSPVIMKWCKEIAEKFPELAAYTKTYTHDSIPWCGLTMAYVMARNGIRPIDGYLWAANWGKFGKRLDKPQLGCVMVFTREGGGHVTLYEGEDEDNYIVRGGNQSDAVNVAKYPKSRFTYAVWPHAFPAMKPVQEPAAKPKRLTNITATIFADESVAYTDVKPGWNDRPGVALPYRFTGKRPKVRVYYHQMGVVCEIVDRGPWNLNDDYWNTSHGRPRAEAQYANRSRAENGRVPTNDAGIDLTPAAARALSLVGKAKVDWEFVGSTGNAAGAGAGVIIVGGGVVGADQANKAGYHPALIGFGFALTVAIAVTAFYLVRKLMRK